MATLKISYQMFPFLSMLLLLRTFAGFTGKSGDRAPPWLAQVGLEGLVLDLCLRCRHRHPALDQRRVTSRRNISARKKRPRIDRANEQDAQPRLHVAPPYVSRVTVTSERAHHPQPSTYACRTVRSCKIENTPSLVSDRNATPAKQNNRTCTVRGHACHAYRRAGSQQPASPQYLSNCS